MKCGALTAEDSYLTKPCQLGKNWTNILTSIGNPTEKPRYFANSSHAIF